MKNDAPTSPSQQYQKIEQAIHYLVENQSSQPSLQELADHIGLSEFYFQRLFTQWAGISPKRFLQFLNKETIKDLLAQGYSNLDAAYQAGLSNGSRLHELFISTEAISPAQYKSMGKNLRINYGFHSSPFGDYLLATTDKGICHLSFIQNNKTDIETEFKNEWAVADIQLQQTITEKTHRLLFEQTNKRHSNITLLLKGTNFQIQVWQALLNIPFSALNDYQGIAKSINKPSAARATASAIAKNKIGYLIPCHRVIRKIGDTGQYRWGSNRKKIILALEASMQKPR